MAKHTISEAARLSGKSRSTIHRHIKDGKITKTISDDGSPLIDTAELHRAYGDLSHMSHAETAPVKHPDTATPDTRNTYLEAELEHLRAERDALRDERDRWCAQAERLTTLLTHEKAGVPSQPHRGATGWFDKLLGRR